MTTENLSSYCLSVRSFFEDISWDGCPLPGQPNYTIDLAALEQSQDWRCSTLSQFFSDIDWTERRQSIAKNYCSISVIHPMALPVGHFFREFAQQASRKTPA